MLFSPRFDDVFRWSRVLQLMNVIDAQLSRRGCEKLDLSLLSFIEQFRKIYIGEQVQRSSKVSSKLNQYLSDGSISYSTHLSLPRYARSTIYSYTTFL